MIAPTITASAARDRVWDAIVVGAGPAGAVAAIGIARKGLSVLLVDRADFPRHKLCGACLNGASIGGLTQLGLATALQQLGGIALERFQLQSGGRKMELNLPSGIAVTRRSLDAMLVEAAISAGAEFLSGTNLKLDAAEADSDIRQLTTSDHGSNPFRARVVVLSTGLATERHTSDPDLSVVAKEGSRIGAGTTTKHFPAEYTTGTIFMAVGQDGYVGLTRTEGNSLNIAAALDRAAVRKFSPKVICTRILDESGFPVTTEMLSGDWRGTIGLTRHRRTPAASRVFAIGDAAGYVEPFTGEGMAWAIRGGQSVVPYVESAVSSWKSGLIEEWSATSRKLIGRRQRLCRILAQVLRHPFAVRSVIRIVTFAPSLGQAVVSRLNREEKDELFDSGAGHSSAARQHSSGTNAGDVHGGGLSGRASGKNDANPVSQVRD